MSDGFSEEVRRFAWVRAGGRCECTRQCPGHAGIRCVRALRPGDWHAHHKISRDAGGADTLENCEALCVPCHQNTSTYGAGSK